MYVCMGRSSPCSPGNHLTALTCGAVINHAGERAVASDMDGATQFSATSEAEVMVDGDD